MKGHCENADCTVAETGICLLHRDPRQCEHFRPEPSGASEFDTTPLAAIETRGTRRGFHLGIELGLEDALHVTQSRYTHLFAVLGNWNAGKTCLLGSLYLMACHGALRPFYAFASSLTLQGFEDRIRRVRKWDRHTLPDQLADHTILADPRKPALLHLGLRELQDSRRHLDLLFTDLPGEWTSSLVDRAETATRFAFLSRADGILIVADGPALQDPPTRHSETHRTKLLLERLRYTIGLRRLQPLVLVVSKCDELDMQRPAAVDTIVEHGASIGLSVSVVLTAAFSRKPDHVENGTGIVAVLRIVLDAPPAPPAIGHTDASTAARCFLRV